MIRQEFIVLHEDMGFPLEEHVDGFFMPSFWKAPDFKSWGSDYYFTYEDPSMWTTIELERLNSEGETEAVFFLHALRKQNAPQGPRFSEIDMESFIRQFESGAFRGFPEAKNIRDWCITSFILETEDPRFKKEFFQTLDRFLEHVKGLIVYPEVMSREEFRSFFSLGIDRQEQEIEPEVEDDDQ
jgi:hypothetical protein